MFIRPHVVKAIFWRNVSSYFSTILGYLFILVFVVAGALFAFSPRFFTENQDNLDQLTRYFPYLLLFLIPAISMGTWSEERKQGTDELLFTLPATDLEILLGKFKAVFSVYTIALLFSLSHCVVLYMLGKPDTGILFSTYLGYWLAGMALLGAGMFASSLTANNTVAFVLGAVFCSIPIFASQVVNGVLGNIGMLMSKFGQADFMAPLLPRMGVLKTLSLPDQLQYFASGLIYMSTILYFVSLCVFFLYLNYVQIGRRHWASEQKMNLGLQHVIRAISFVAILFCVNSWFWDTPTKADMTAENFYTLSPTTAAILNGIDKDQQITIQAFVSDDVPAEFINTRKTLLGLLKEFDVRGGSHVDLRLVSVTPFSPQSEEARNLGITPRQLQAEVNGEFMVMETFMGAVITSSNGEVLIPFFDLGVKIEYELARAISAVSNKTRQTVGILKTDAKATGGFDMTTFRNSPEWRIVTEIKKQYKVEEVSADTPIDESKYAVLVAILPSSLNQQQMVHLVDYVKKGKPTLIFDDPVPVFNLEMAPHLPKPRAGGGMFGGGPPPEQKADDGTARSLVNALGFQWNNREVVFDSETPEPKYANVAPAELNFICSKSNSQDAFSEDSPITKGLQLMLAYFPGELVPIEKAPFEFVPLLHSGKVQSGTIDWDKLMVNFLGSYMINPSRVHEVDKYRHILAAYIGTKDDKLKRNVIYVADVDMLTDNLVTIAEQQLYDLKIDNVVFVLNSIDFLSGNKDFIELRKKRLKDRRLESIERETNVFVQERETAEKDARKSAEDELAVVQKRFDEQLKKIREDNTIDDRAKQRLLRNLEETENKRLEVTQRDIDRKRDQLISDVKSRSERKIRDIKEQTRLIATLISSLPAILFGSLILLSRMVKEKSHIQSERQVQK
jgi:ABC-2 type transport system permease protein